MDDFTSIQYRRRLAQITGIDSLIENTIDESAKERERITDIINDINIDMKSLQPGDSLHAHLTKKKKELQKKLHSLKEENIDEDFKVGRKVNVTNPKATPRYEITGKDDTHYHLKGPDDKTMKLPKERIHRVNKVNEEQIDEVEKPTTKMSFNDDHKRKAALNLYHRMVGDSLRSGETYPRAHQIGVAMVKHDHGQFGLDHLKNHFKEMKKHAKHLSVD